MAKVHTSRNPELVPGIGRYSRSTIYKKRALYKRKKTGVKKVVKEQEKFKRKEIGGDKNGGSRVVPVKREVCHCLFTRKLLIALICLTFLCALKSLTIRLTALATS